ncbi:hypothetical protein LTR20_007519 [Exophiala xenobiotica]|nr:hypothetical protein LTS13_007943 [Exophiala xenobiotica]KAK5406975.1 hypothetical protein LTR90_010232 [Exophiala xenobiotica]KAK5460212.1 hypothetical protein LTR20_007519 [Exophiala xenobiotica]KAK5501257.1 hypothetical protein LTR26_000950 [Exophiala xenobiotica]KAK5506398.1 hypothetical protein LTR83_000951 [Exophiala xenobiotica]
MSAINGATWDEEYDAISVGSGIGGLSTAVTAAECGVKALVIEKFDLLGGVSALSSGQLWPGPNHIAEAAGIPDSAQKAKEYIDHLGQGHACPKIRDQYFTRSTECLKYFDARIGVPMMVIRGLPDYYYPEVAGSAPEGRYVEVIPFPAAKLGEYKNKVLTSPYGAYYSYSTSTEWVEMQEGGESIGSCIQRHLANDERCAGAGMAAALVYAALQRKVEFRTSTEVVELVAEDSRATGVIVRDSSGTRRIRARLGVVLATGGYDWNRRFVSSFDALPVAGSMALPTVTGDHILLCSKLGVIPMPSRAPAKVSRFDGQEDGLVNWPAWIVFDQSMLNQRGMPPVLPGQPLLEGMAIEANTLTELAVKAQIDPEGLETTVERFNKMCSNGVDEDFKRGSNPWGRLMAGDPKLKNPNMAPISQAPFYAMRLERVTMGVPTAGLPIDGDGRVENSAGDIISGLYAAGNSAAWGDWGGGFNSGIAGMRGLLYGYLAALHMTAT